MHCDLSLSMRCSTLLLFFAIVRILCLLLLLMGGIGGHLFSSLCFIILQVKKQCAPEEKGTTMTGKAVLC